jgi:hypothetical protein
VPSLDATIPLVSAGTRQTEVGSSIQLTFLGDAILVEHERSAAVGKPDQAHAYQHTERSG